MVNKVENLLLIYSADEGTLKVLLEKNEDEPYKGYWIIPGDILGEDVTQKDFSCKLFEDITSLKNDEFIQGGVFSDIDRNPYERVIAIVSIMITDKSVADLNKKENYSWFDIDELPKLAYDHKNIIENVTNEIKDKIIGNYSNILIKFFPSDFTLPEFQKFYENVLGKNIDRRNFRKKIMTQNLVIDTGEKTTSGTGRPGTLYRFNVENLKGKRL